MLYSIIALVGELIIVHAIGTIATIPSVFITIVPIDYLSGTISYNKLTLDAIFQTDNHKFVVNTISIGSKYIGNLQLDGRGPIHRIFCQILNYRILLHSLSDLLRSCRN